jgi:aminoglycoside phosphotransferase (APT) family kinase protein
MSPAELRALDALVAGLPERLAAIDACGLPATLVHGDFHPGNWRGDAEHLTLIDWGDSFAGHPLFDALRFAAAPEVFAGAWRAVVPGCDPERAMTLLRPVAALRAARVYRSFLDQIEPSEHCYHAHDTEEQLRAAIG